MSVSESSITNSSEVETLAIQPQKLLILDARSYAAAVANRAKGGGCECPGGSFQLVPGVIFLHTKIKNSFCFLIYLTTVLLMFQSTIPTVRWCLWAWPTSTPFARVSSLCVSSALRCLIQPSRFFFYLQQWLWFPLVITLKPRRLKLLNIKRSRFAVVTVVTSNHSCFFGLALHQCLI